MTPRRHTRPAPDTPDRARLQIRPSSLPLLRLAEASLVEEWQRARARGSARTRELAAFLLDANRTLLGRMARRYRTTRLAAADLEHAAVVGFLTALERYDTSRGVPLAGYASYWVRKEIQRTLASGDYPVAIPPHRLDDLGEARAILAGNRNTGPPHGVSDHLARILSIGALNKENESSLADDNGAIEAELEALDLIHHLQQEVSKLPAPQRDVVVVRYGLDGGVERSAREVGRLLGVSDFTVRTRLSKAIGTLRRRLASWRPDST